jgi:hypothetical protein
MGLACCCMPSLFGVVGKCGLDRRREREYSNNYGGRFACKPIDPHMTGMVVITPPRVTQILCK